MKPPSFFDNFFVITTVIAALLSAVDWLIGSAGRDRLQRKIGDWWVSVEETSFGEHVSQDARWLLQIYKNMFVGYDAFDTCVKRCMFIMAPGMFIYFMTGIFWFFFYAFFKRPEISGEVGHPGHAMIFPAIVSFGAGFLGIWLVGWLLRILSKSDRSASVMLCISATAVYLIAITGLAGLSVALANIFEFVIRPLYQPNAGAIAKSW